MLRFTSILRAGLWLCGLSALQLAPAAISAAPILDPFSGTVDVRAYSNLPGSNNVFRTTSAPGPLTDTAAEVFGPDSATGSATVDARGLHASATVLANNPDGYTPSAVGLASLVNPFMIVPRAGFSGTQALVRIPYSLTGSFNSSPSLLGCPTCTALVDARLDVDGMAQNFSFVGSHSLATMGGGAFVAGGVSMGGVFEGLLPVNTVLYLRGALLTYAYCQGGMPSSCASEALFGGALSYAGFSPDDVDIVWALTPTLVPEPASAALLAMGLLGLAPVPRAVRASSRGVIRRR